MHYLIIKEKNKKSIVYFEYDKIKGYNLTSKNKNIKLKDAINVNKMVIINPSFIEKLINKNIDKKFKKLLNFIINLYEDSDDPSSNMMLALNEVEKFKREIINKYLDYMNKKQLKKLQQDIQYLEKQITLQSYLLNEEKAVKEVDYETRKSR